MTQTTVTQAPGPGGHHAPVPDQPGPDHPTAPAPAGGPGAVSRPVSALRRALQGTPGGLRVVAAVTVLACLAFAVLGALAFADRREALADARADAAQLVRVQEISINLVRADAAATNAFLAQGTGLPPADLMRTYEDAISTASRRIADAARAQPADAPALALVNDDLTDYTSRIASALRAKRDASTPTLATGYLSLASQTVLRESMLPRLNGYDTEDGVHVDGVVDRDARRVEDAFAASDRAGVLLLASGIAVVVILLVGGAWMARRTRRVLNVPLTAATGAVALALVLGGLAMASAQAQARDVKNTSYSATQALAQARIAANRAKADESITLIRQNFTRNRTTGEYQDPASATIQAAQQLVGDAERAGYSGPVSTLLQDWRTAHDDVIDKVNKNRLPEAIAAATEVGGSAGPSNGAFAAFDREAAKALDQQATRAFDGLAGPGALLLLLSLIALLVGLAAAASAWLGVSQRLEEYR